MAVDWPQCPLLPPEKESGLHGLKFTWNTLVVWYESLKADLRSQILQSCMFALSKCDRRI